MSNIYEYIKEHFTYNKDGTFNRNDRKNANGSYDHYGYLIIKIKGKQYKAHRLVYLYFNGKFPKNEIDHINRIRSDNKIENLRDVTRQQNMDNTKFESLGVYVDYTNGLKKKYAFRFKKKMYRFYSLQEAITTKEKLGGKINYDYYKGEIV